MKAYSDDKTIVKNAIILGALGVILILGSTLEFFLVKDKDALISVIILAAVGLFALALMPIVLKRKKSGCVFEIADDSIIIGSDIIKSSDIQHINVSAVLGVLKPIKPEYADIDLMVTLPPVPELVGSIQITTLNKKYKFLNIKNVMELYTELHKLTDDIEGWYTLYNQIRSYKYGIYKMKKEQME